MKIDNNELVDFCKKKWNVTDSNDPQIKKFEQNIDNFMKLFNGDEVMLIKKLIRQFMYYDALMVRDQMINMYEQLKIEKGFNENNTIFVAIEKYGMMSSSVGYICELILSNREVNRYMFRQGGLNAYSEEELSVISNIVILDDICGSGSSFDTFLKENYIKLKDKNVYYIVIHIMEEAREHIDKMKYNSINISYKSHNQTSKAFKNNQKERNKFEIISKSLGYTGDETIYGFKDSEALVAFYNNSPNNTLGIFIKKTNRNQYPLFPRRYDKEPDYLEYKNNKKRRKNERYEAGKNYG